MKSLKLQFTGIILVAACLMMPTQSMAQWSIGASYEMREEVPENGFGLRIERDILQPIPIIDIGLRAHFSFFNEENEFGTDNQSISGEFTYYDYGLAATGGVSLGLFKPYVGLGIGNNNVDFSSDGDGNDFDDSQFFWNGFIGTELTIIPKLHPFVEYRFQQANEPDDIEFSTDSNGRLILGLSLSF